MFPGAGRRPWWRWTRIVMLWLGIFTLLALFDSAQTYLLLNAVRREIPFEIILVRGIAEWYLWALLAPLLFWAVRRLPLDAEF